PRAAPPALPPHRVCAGGLAARRVPRLGPPGWLVTTDDATAPTRASPRRRRLSARARLGIVGLTGAFVLGVFAVNGLQDNMVYYHTPSEVVASQGDRVRLGGLVADGSIERTGGLLTFNVTDGVTEVPV